MAELLDHDPYIYATPAVLGKRRLGATNRPRPRVCGRPVPGLAMLERRISAIKQASLITRDTGLLIREIDAGNPARAKPGSSSLRPLQSKIGVGSLLSYWGGEALYGRHNSEQEIEPILAAVGTAQIIEAVVPLSRMRLISFPGHQMTQQSLVTRGVDVSDRDYVDKTKFPAPADRIRAVISRSEPAFEALTGCATWRRRSCEEQATRCLPKGWAPKSQRERRSRWLWVGHSLPWFVSSASRRELRANNIPADLSLRIRQTANKTHGFRTGKAVKFIPCSVTSGHNAFFSYQLKVFELLETSWWAL